MEFSNFQGVRLSFKAVPTKTILLKTQINLDDLESMKNFESNKLQKAEQNYQTMGRCTDVLGCKIKGIKDGLWRGGFSSYSWDWTRVVKIQGWDYIVNLETIVSFLGYYGEK